MKSVVFCRSNPVAPDPRVEKLAHALQQGGYDVSIIAWDRTARFPVEDTFQGIPIHRQRIPAAFGSGLANLPALLRWQVGLMRWLARNHTAFDILHACDFDTILPALVCKLLWKKAVVYDIFDFYAEHLRRTPEGFKRLIRFVDIQAINAADGVILVDDARVKQIAGSRPKACISIYNSPEDELSSLPADPVPSDGYHLRIAYIGLLQVERGIFEMLDVLRRHPDWHLDLAGFGGDEERIVQAVNSMPNVAWHGRVPYRRALELSFQADVLFATYDPAIPNHRYSSPNKVFEGMMLGKPVIVARDTNMDAMIQDAGCGIIVQYGEERELEQALERLAGDAALRQRLGQNARRAYEMTYSWQRMRDRLTEFYARILEEED